jgi:hypothetical protein
MRQAQRHLLTAVRAWQSQVQRSKPPVPPDCRGVDGFVLTAIMEEARQASTLLQLLPNVPPDRTRKLARDAMTAVDQRIAGAQQELDRVYRSRQAQGGIRLRTSAEGLLGRLAR